MQRIAFNIETAADPDRIAAIPEPEVLCGNLKDPIKIAEKHAAAKASQIEKAALDPNFAKVICISTARRVGTEIITATFTPDADATEADIITRLWDSLRAENAAPGETTFNGAAFDVPFLTRRSLILGIRPVHIETNKYQVTDPALSEHLDVMQALHQGEPGNGSNPLGYPRTLGFYAELLLHEKFPYADLDQSKLGELMANGQADTVRKLCEWNAIMTLRLAELLSRSYA